MSHANEHQAPEPAPVVASLKTVQGEAVNEASDPWPLWEVFVRHRQGLEHKHCGSLHAADAQQALNMARDVYTRRQEGVSIWVVPSHAITASTAEHSEAFFDPMADKIYRHPSFYRLPQAVDHM
jgi:ring-1,2-phenylacetyl-CoA epoxidase subunit PaaB